MYKKSNHNTNRYKYCHMLNNAFTLIELLAVILILGIIALIAIPVVNDILKESRMVAFSTSATTLANKAVETCQLEGIEGKNITRLYTIVEGEFDRPLEVKGDMPDEGYILVNNNCEVAYSFYDEANVVSKNFKEAKPTVNNKDTAPAYGLKWQSNTVEGDDYLTDTYTRTLDASSIKNNDVNVQIGDVKGINVFDDLDIYKDILPYTDEFGNEFMLIPKFYISKTKEETSTDIIWNYAVSKHKLDDNYYLPSNFVDEGVDNNQHMELPYVLVGKYEAGSNGKTGSEEMLVSKSGLMPKVSININTARTLATRYNDIEGINGYQQYDIHVHDLLTMLFAIEFGKMNSQFIMNGYVGNSAATTTGGSDMIEMSSGTISNDGHYSFNYRGIENLWGNVWSFLEGLNIDQNNGTPNSIYTANNARFYSSDTITEYYKKLEGYSKLDTSGVVVDSGFDPKVPFANLPTKIGGDYTKGVGDYYYQKTSNGYRISLAGGDWAYGTRAGMSHFVVTWYSSDTAPTVGVRILKTPLQG